jgi:regulator of sirC expression with transglutaminase-like and TPR domain
MMAGHTANERWQRIATAPAGEVSLAEGALLIAAEEYPSLARDHYLQLIEEMGSTLRARLRRDISTSEALLALNHYFYDDLGFGPNADDYYDPRNSFLNEVIDRRRGIPITLAVLYIEIGRRIGLPLYGVSFPSNFLVKCTLRDGVIVLDPFARGASLGIDDLRERLKAVVGDVELTPEVMKTMLAAADPRDVFARMLRNLRSIYARRGDRLKALAASDRIITLQPAAAEEYRERAHLYVELECLRGALADYRSYLRHRPHAADAEEIRRRVAELEPQAARLN